VPRGPRPQRRPIAPGFRARALPQRASPAPARSAADHPARAALRRAAAAPPAAMEMTQSALREICIEHKLYRTPALNDSLYCNHKGFGALANLEAYTALKALYLEGNVLRSLEGLPPLAELKCL
jgi:hypothetical protein